MVTNRDRKSFGSPQKNSKICSDWHHWRLICVQAFRDQPAVVRCPVAQLLIWIWSIISRVVTVFGRPGQGASQVEKSPRLNWTTQFLTVAHDGACSPYVSVIMAWISFSASTCREKKTLWQQASPCCWNRAPRLTCFLSASVTRKLAIRHMNRPLVPTALSIPSYDIG